MIKTFILLWLCVGLGFVSYTRGQSGIVGFTTVAFDDQDQIVGGISETYLTYDIAYYYDAGADGLLSYQNPYEPIDGDIGEGINDTYFDLQFGLMYGIEVDYTTNDYRRNKVACADTIHYVRLVYVPPIPFAPDPYYDPFQLGSISPGTYENSLSLTTQSSPTESYSGSDVEIVGYTYACIRTPTVGSVVFEELNSSISNNPTGDFGNGVVFAGGKRIFADRQFPNDETDRKVVRVKARLLTSGGNPTYTQGVKVYFKNFDVDDPSSDAIIDDNGTSGNDNRENRTAGAPYPQSAAGSLAQCTFSGNACYALTDSNGFATVNFVTTKQPGDNFVIGVSTDEQYLGQVTVNGIGLKDSSNQQLPTPRAQRSELLTVWRKVHLEVDSMGPVGNNLAAGIVRTKTSVGPTPVWLNVTVNTGSLEINRFQGGRMKHGPHNFEVVENTATAVRVRNPAGNVNTTINGLYQLFDDDDFNDTDGAPPGDGTLDGDDGEDVTFRGNSMFEETFSRLQPITDLSQNPLDKNPYAAAYIEPDYAWAEAQPGMNDTNVQFQLNVAFTPPNYDNERSIVNQNRDSAGLEHDEFWIGHILIAYQPDDGWTGGTPSVLDGDPNDSVLAGTAPPISWSLAWTDSVVDSLGVTPGSIGALIYIEAMRDSDAFDAGDYRIRAAPHELGHQFGIRGDNPVFDFGIMGAEGSLYFVRDHINIMRWRRASPGEN